jgi:lipoprotein signal peptidase
MTERSYRLLFWCLALTGLLVDQASKYGIFAWLHGPGEREWVIFQVQDRQGEKQGFRLVARHDVEDGRLVPHVNRGALFGWKGFLPPAAANVAFSVISLLAAGAIIFWSTLKVTARDAWLCSSLGLILGGTIGNFYDRVVFGGVRDFLHWNYLFDWPVFNLADCCLVCGACLLFLQAFLGQPLLGSSPQAAGRNQAVPVTSEATSMN